MGILSSFFHLDRYMILARVVIILLILPLHEFAHGWMARRCGDDTADLSGRLTLNPIAHIDPIGSILLLLTGFGWAKPVPINPVRMRNMHRGVILTSLAGPVSNLIASFVGVIGMQIVFPFYQANVTSAVLAAIYQFLYFFVLVNLNLALFNLIPVPPLDGSKVLMGLLPYRQSAWLQQHQQILTTILWILILVGVLSIPLGWLSDLLLKGFVWATNWIHTLIAAVI